MPDRESKITRNSFGRSACTDGSEILTVHLMRLLNITVHTVNCGEREAGTHDRFEAMNSFRTQAGSPFDVARLSPILRTKFSRSFSLLREANSKERVCSGVFRLHMHLRSKYRLIKTERSPVLPRPINSHLYS